MDFGNLGDLVPGESEVPFYTFIFECTLVFQPIAADLTEAIEARENWRDASMKTTPQELRKIVDATAMSEERRKQLARVGKERPLANLRATGILITLQAILEDVRRSVIENTREQFGPLINDVPFSHLLQAGANSCRHGAEWWRLVGSVWMEPGFVLLTDDEQRKLLDESWSKEQRFSIEVLAKALGKGHIDASNQPASDVLWLLSDGGDARLLFDRMMETVVAIARAKGRLSDYNRAAKRLGWPPAS
jgi:hypothetical protein